jgi:hypothetical protein
MPMLKEAMGVLVVMQWRLSTALAAQRQLAAQPMMRQVLATRLLAVRTQLQMQPVQVRVPLLPAFLLVMALRVSHAFGMDRHSQESIVDPAFRRILEER